MEPEPGGERASVPVAEGTAFPPLPPTDVPIVPLTPPISTPISPLPPPLLLLPLLLLPLLPLIPESPCLAQTKTALATRPVHIAATFCAVAGTPNATSPTAATGTLLRLPTSEKVVAVVVDRNQSEVNEMPKASAAEAPAAARNRGSPSAGSLDARPRSPRAHASTAISGSESALL